MLLDLMDKILSYCSLLGGVIFNSVQTSVTINDVLIKALITSCLYVLYRYAATTTTASTLTREKTTPNDKTSNCAQNPAEKDTTDWKVVCGVLCIAVSSTKFLVLYFLLGLVAVVWKLVDRGLGLSLHNVIKAFDLNRTWKNNVEGTYNTFSKYFLSPVMAYLMVSVISLLFSSVFEVTEGYRIFHIPRHYLYSSRQMQYVLESVEVVSDMTFLIGSILFVKQYIQSLLKHSYREHEEDNVMGWNVFQHHPDGSATFTIPTEQSQSMANIVDDKWLHEMVIDAARTSHPQYPSFMMILPSDEHTANFVRHMTNNVSQRIAISQWPQYALASRIDQSDLHEPALMLVACEKDVGVRNRCTRTWLVFASELRWLLGFSEKDIDDPTKFKVANEDWRIRIKNLRRWAEVEADPSRKKHMSQKIIIPVNASSVVTDCFQDYLQGEGQSCWPVRPSFGLNQSFMLKSRSVLESQTAFSSTNARSSIVASGRKESRSCNGSIRISINGSGSNNDEGDGEDESATDCDDGTDTSFGNHRYTGFGCSKPTDSNIIGINAKENSNTNSNTKGARGKKRRAQTQDPQLSSAVTPRRTSMRLSGA